MNQNILVIKLGAFGDIVLAFDAFHAIRTHHRRDRIVLLTRPAYATWAKTMPWFDEVWAEPRLSWCRVLQWLRWGSTLRNAGFTRVYDLQGNDRTALYFHLLGRRKPEWSGPVRGCSHPRPDFRGQRLPAYERLLRQLEAAGVPRAGPADLSWLDGDLSAFSLPQRYVILVPGCSAHRPEKRWPASSFAALANRLQADGVACVAVGTRSDQATLAELMALAPHVLNLADRTNFGQLAALARRALAVVGNDTGPVHLMAAVGAPTVVLYSAASDPFVVRPNGPSVAWLQRPRLRDLEVDEVWALLVQTWREAPDSGPHVYPAS
ncbi:MAG: glycosyltransferase family 9 protein [Limisphaera sp.]|nr:glycosyltransferase family 9 protein [Limisphaera sp.]